MVSRAQSALEEQLPVAMQTLEDMRNDFGRNFKMLPELMDECKEAGHDLRVQGGRDEVWLEASIKKWLRSLCDHLRMYFPNMPKRS